MHLGRGGLCCRNLKKNEETVQIELGLDDPSDPAAIARLVARAVGGTVEPGHVQVLRRSIDARGGRVRFRLLVAQRPSPARLGEPLPVEVAGPEHVVIVGAGPAGLFAAYELARNGVRSTVVDRGKPVQPRRHDLKALNRDGVVDPDSNYCFGEGGAGTYSDGKLYTRAHKRGSVRDVIETLALHGAPRDVLVDARPHIGSNRLPKVVTALRERLESLGVGFRFGARVDAILTRGAGDALRAVGVGLRGGDEIHGDAVVLATGHSARDAFGLARRAGVRLEPKPFAVGARVEHPQPLIDRIQYGRSAGHPRLPAASYRLATQIRDRGVYSFCMCPGGFVVPAATEPDGLVVNGMSLSKRDSPYANAGVVVSIETSDLRGDDPVTSGVDFQRRIERDALAAGGGALRAPATRVVDFLAGRGSSTVPTSSYLPGLAAGDLAEVLDAGGVGVADKLRLALARFERALPGFVTEEAVLIGVETRTSSPVRMPRHRDTLESETAFGLYPCGEGAGYAGGIVSAALDGKRVAIAITRALGRLS